MSARAEDAQSRPGSSGFVKAFESLGPPPNLPPAQPQGLKEDDRPPSMRELLESFATRKKAEKEEKDQQERAARSAMEENVAQEGEESVLKTVNLLRSHTFNNREGSRKRRRQEQAEVGEQLVAMEAHLMASHRCVLTFYSAGGLFFTMRFLRDRALSEEDLDPPPSPRSRLVLRTLVVAAWRCLRIALNVGATQDVIDIITNYGLVEVVCTGLRAFQNDWELHVSGLDLVCFLLDRSKGHDVWHDVGCGGLISCLGGAIKRALGSVRTPDPFMHHALFLALHASLRLSGTAKHGSRFAVGLAMHQDWATLTCLLQLLTLRMHAMDAHEDVGGLPDAVLELLECTSCALLLCMVARSSIVANRLSCQSLVAPLLSAIRQHRQDKEVLRWLKGALLELEACRVRGHLDEKRPSLASLLGLGQAHAHADDASTRGKGKGVRRDHMTASQFAQSILQDHKLKRQWVASIDSYIHRHAPSAVKKEVLRDQRRLEAAYARHEGHSMWEGVSPYAQPVVPGIFRELAQQEHNKARRLQPLHSGSSTILQAAVGTNADKVRAGDTSAVGPSRRTSVGNQGYDSEGQGERGSRRASLSLREEGEGTQAGRTTTVHADEPFDGQLEGGEGKGKKGGKKKKGKKGGKKAQGVEEYGLIPDEAIAATWHRQHMLQVNNTADSAKASKPVAKALPGKIKGKKAKEPPPPPPVSAPKQPPGPQVLKYTEEASRAHLSLIAKRLLGDPPQDAYATSVHTQLDQDRPDLDKMSYAERLQVMLLSVEKSVPLARKAEEQGEEDIGHVSSPYKPGSNTPGWALAGGLKDAAKDAPKAGDGLMAEGQVASGDGLGVVAEEQES